MAKRSLQQDLLSLLLEDSSIPQFVERSWFGGRAIIYGELLVLAFFETKDRTSPWNGLLIPTSLEHQASLIKSFPKLAPHPILKKWLYLKRQTPAFERHAKQILLTVQSLDPRIGILRGAKHRKQAATKGDAMSIEQSRNIGPKSAEALRSIGVHLLSDLRHRGWESVLEKLHQRRPEFCNLNMARALIGALENLDWREIPQNDVLFARRFLRELKS